MVLQIGDEPPIIFDLGTGLRYFGRTQPRDGSFRGTCLLSHLHWDHTQGLPFFTPILEAGSRLDIYAPIQEDGRPVVEALGAFIQPPHFPISIEHLPGTLRFHDISDCDFPVGSAIVRSRLIPHVGNTLGYRVDVGDASVAYLSDHQQPYDGSLSVTNSARELVEGVDVLVHDAQFTADEFERKCTWGHCTVDYAVWLAVECNVKTLVLFHHDPTRTDDAIDKLAASASVLAKDSDVSIVAAREGLVISLARTT